MASHYTLTTASTVAKTKSTNRWVEIDISTALLSDLFLLYRKVEIPLFDFFGNEKTLVLHDYEPELKNYNGTLSKWLTSIGDRKLDVIDGLPSLVLYDVPYVPIGYHAGTVQPAKSGYHPSQDVVVEDYDDLIVTMDDFDPRMLSNYCLFSANGFTFPTKYQDYGARVLYASDAIRDAGTMEAGYLNFEHVGKLQYVPITKNMVTKMDDTKTYFDTVAIDTTVDITNKTVGIVIGGYLHLLDDLIRVIGPKTISLSMRNYPLYDRVMQSMGTLELDFMNLGDINNSVPVSEFYNEDNLLAYLTCKYSFLVIIDNSEMTVDLTAVSKTAMLGTYIIKDDRKLGKLTDQYGKGIEYWPIWECGQWALKSTQFELDTTLHKTSGWENLVRINDARLGARRTKKVDLTMHEFFARGK